MRRLLIPMLVPVFLALVVTPLASQTAKPKVVTVAGAVTAVTLDSVSVKGKAGDWQFAVNRDTSVTVKGATRKNLALKAEAKASTLPQFIKAGDNVSVSYHEMGATKVADSIRVLAVVPVK